MEFGLIFVLKYLLEIWGPFHNSVLRELLTYRSQRVVVSRFTCMISGTVVEVGHSSHMSDYLVTNHIQPQLQSMKQT